MSWAILLKELLDNKEVLMDIINKATKLFDHNRGLAFGLIGLAACLYIPSCAAWDGEVVSSQTGEVVNADEREGEYVEIKKTLQTRAQELEATILALSNEYENIAEQSDTLDEEFVEDMERIQSEIDARTEGIMSISTAAAQQVPGLAWLLPWVGIGTTAVAGGAVFDNRRKDKIIKKVKAPS